MAESDRITVLTDRIDQCRRCGHPLPLEPPRAELVIHECEHCQQVHLLYPDGRVAPISELDAAGDLRALRAELFDQLAVHHDPQATEAALRTLRRRWDADTRQLLAHSGAPPETWTDLPTHHDIDPER